MSITYRKMRALMKERGITSYVVKQEKLFGQATWTAIQHDKNINTKILDVMCRLFQCQPGDLLEYIDD